MNFILNSMWNFIKRIYGFLLFMRVSFAKGLNIRKTVIINFRFLPLSQAWYFPVFVYGKMEIKGNGKIIINVPIRMALINIGMPDYLGISNDPSLFYNYGTVIFSGYFISSYATTIAVHNKINQAVIVFGENIFMGMKNNFQAFERIEIGSHTRMAHQIQVFDTNFHYIIDTKTGNVPSLCAPVIIGKSCWIGNRSNLMKGCCLPKGTIVASGSLANKDYRSVFPENCVVAGTPIQKKVENKRRILLLQHEAVMHKFYKENESSLFCNSEGLIDIV